MSCLSFSQLEAMNIFNNSLSIGNLPYLKAWNNFYNVIFAMSLLKAMIIFKDSLSIGNLLYLKAWNNFYRITDATLKLKANFIKTSLPCYQLKIH